MYIHRYLQTYFLFITNELFDTQERCCYLECPLTLLNHFVLFTMGQIESVQNEGSYFFLPLRFHEIFGQY